MTYVYLLPLIIFFIFLIATFVLIVSLKKTTNNFIQTSKDLRKEIEALISVLEKDN